MCLTQAASSNSNMAGLHRDLITSLKYSDFEISLLCCCVCLLSATPSLFLSGSLRVKNSMAAIKKPGREDSTYEDLEFKSEDVVLYGNLI